jgi:hypothetical protein
MFMAERIASGRQANAATRVHLDGRRPPVGQEDRARLGCKCMGMALAGGTT